MWTVYSSYTNKCVISEICDRSLIISDMEYVSLLCPPPPVFCCQWTAHGDVIAKACAGHTILCFKTWQYIQNSDYNGLP